MFFAYSNEIEKAVFSDITNNFVYNIPYTSNYETFANVRFDVRTEEPIQYHSDRSSFDQSILARSPDPTLGYTDNRGSDVLNVLQKFLDNTQAPLCGSLVYVLGSRYPDEADVSHLISRLRENHVFVYIIAKATPSAGNNHKALFDVASATNGFCVFADTNEFRNAADFGINILIWNSQYIAQNYVVSGSGSIEVPPFPSPDPLGNNVLVVITLQDHALDNNVSMNYTIIGVDGGGVSPAERYLQYGTFTVDWPWLEGTDNFNWTIEYSYPDTKPQRMEVRMYTRLYQDFLPLPPI